MKPRRIIWPSAEQVALEEGEPPAMGPEDVFIQTAYSVISVGTELAWLRGQANASNQFPQYPGYSASGQVVDVGQTVHDLKPGDRVVAYHLGHTSHGVRPRHCVFEIGDDRIDLMHAAMTIIAAMSLQGIRKARIELGESVVVMGLGLLGLFAVQMARLHGGLPVIAIDFNAARRDLAVRLGADAALSPDDEQLGRKILELTRRRGADSIIEATGSADAVKQALHCASPRGRVILLGCNRQPTDAMDFYQDVHKPGAVLIGAHNFVRPEHDSSPGFWTLRDDMQVLLRLLSSDRLAVEPMIGLRVTPDQAPEVYQRLLAGDRGLLGVVLDWRKTGDGR